MILVGCEAESSRDASDGRVGGGHIRVGSEIKVKHRRIGPLDQDPFARVICVVNVLDGIRHEGLDGRRDVGVLGHLSIYVVLVVSAEALAAVKRQLAQLIGKELCA